jgi:hypothetical protein
LFTNIQAQSLSEKLVAFGFTKFQVSKCDEARNESYYTEEEKNLFLLINLVRQNPRYFGANLDRFCEEFCVEEGNYVPSYSGDVYYAELKNDLLRLKTQPKFSPDINLYKAAKDHAIDAGTNGFTGHVSSNGDKLEDRMAKYKKGNFAWGECCDYGYKYAPNILLHLLVDDGVVSRGHRLAILDSGTYGYKIIGISIQPHISSTWNTVIDFTNPDK